MPRLRPNRAIVTLLYAAILAGLAWSFLAQPGEYVVAFSRLTLTETEVSARFSVIVTYVLISGVVAFAWGWFGYRFLNHYGTLMVGIYILVLAIAAWIAFRVGVAFGPPDPNSLQGLVEGDTAEAQLALDSWVPGIAWPLGGLLGLLVGQFFATREPDESPDTGVVTEP